MSLPAARAPASLAGKVFSPDDQKNMVSICRVNTTENRVGHFGIGFYSVFSFCQRPQLHSGLGGAR